MKNRYNPHKILYTAHDDNLTVHCKTREKQWDNKEALHIFVMYSVYYSIWLYFYLNVAYGQISYGSEVSSWVLSEASEPRGFLVGVGE